MRNRTTSRRVPPELLQPQRLKPTYKERVWGGTALAQHATEQYAGPIGEAWLIHEDQHLLPGLTLTDATRRYPELLLGPGARPQRFPLLIKLLDCQEWLSVQVHPDDHQAQRLVAPDANGKTEAWHVLQASPGAKVVSGVDARFTPRQLSELIHSRRIAPAVQLRQVSAGDTILVPAGTVHAIGPGLLIYEVQQSSDVTYRVYDWDRSETHGRQLHLKEAAEVARPGEALFVRHSSAIDAPPVAEETLIQCPYFTLTHLLLNEQPLERSTTRTGLECLTVIEGVVTLKAGATHLTLPAYETVLLPAVLGPYLLSGHGTLLSARLPVSTTDAWEPSMETRPAEGQR